VHIVKVNADATTGRDVPDAKIPELLEGLKKWE